MAEQDAGLIEPTLSVPVGHQWYLGRIYHLHVQGCFPAAEVQTLCVLLLTLVSPEEQLKCRKGTDYFAPVNGISGCKLYTNEATYRYRSHASIFSWTHLHT